VNIEYYAISNCGPYRSINQDCFCCNNALYAHTKRISLPSRKSFVLDGEVSIFAVADGMGGHEAGEEASKFAIERFCEKIRFSNLDSERAKSIIQNNIIELNRELNNHGTMTQHPDMGTTLTGVLFWEERVYSYHCGDSRLYIYNPSEVSLVTEDHSLAYEKKSGVYKHFLTSCIGGGSPKIRVDVEEITTKIQPNTILILTTDGLHEVLENDFFLDLLSDSMDPVKIAKISMQESLFRESQDNLTIIVIKINTI
jgi:PPM family protein phosphatase